MKNRNRLAFILGIILLILILFREQIFKATQQLTNLPMESVDTIIDYTAGILITVLSIIVLVAVLPLVWKIVILGSAIILAYAFYRSWRNKNSITLNEKFIVSAQGTGLEDSELMG